MTAFERFQAKVRTSDTGCHEWRGCTRKDGYGSFFLNDKIMLAHRAAYLFAYGALPPHPIKICHRCDNRGCVNPAHLFVGTQLDNVRDMLAKGRRVQGDLSGETNGNAKLTGEEVATIRSSPLRGRVLAREYRVSESLISMIKSRKLWRI